MAVNVQEITSASLYKPVKAKKAENIDVRWSRFNECAGNDNGWMNSFCTAQTPVAPKLFCPHPGFLQSIFYVF